MVCAVKCSVEIFRVVKSYLLIGSGRLHACVDVAGKCHIFSFVVLAVNHTLSKCLEVGKRLNLIWVCLASIAIKVHGQLSGVFWLKSVKLDFAAGNVCHGY